MSNYSNKGAAQAGFQIGRIRLLIYSLIPLVMMVSGGEIVLRIFDLDRPSFYSRPLPEEIFGAFQQDSELFWSMRPNLRVMVETTTYPEAMKLKTNSLGLRYPEIKRKASNEFRILSLGESTTFGAYVNNDQTYSARLEAYLNNHTTMKSYKVINAGVSAYSSFQSLMYLKLRGLKLNPDMVLFYHEFNDYLPSSLRSSNNTEVGIVKTDMQLYESMSGSLERKLLAWSALIRFLVYRLASYKISKTQEVQEELFLDHIGLERFKTNGGIYRFDDATDKEVALNHDALPRRVSSDERRKILTELVNICRLHDISLIIIHPSYMLSEKHDCILTQFCLANKIPMFEAQDVLHGPDILSSNVFYDYYHPTPYGHRLMAEGLFKFIEEEQIILLQ